MVTQLKESRFLGHSSVKARNEHLELVLVPDLGSSVIALRHLDTNVELFRTPRSHEEYDRAPFVFGMPILFPPNRIADGTFTFEGKIYRFPINDGPGHNALHGLLYDRKWDLVEAKVAGDEVILKTSFESSRCPEVLEQFPHEFVLQLEVILSGSTLRTRALLTNHGTEAFPWGLGYHTTFNCSDQACLAVTVDRRWELNNRLLPTGRLIDDELDGTLRHGVPLSGLKLDDVFLSARDGLGGNQAKLQAIAPGVDLVYTCAAPFSQWVIYTGDGFICLEPYSWVTNAPNLPAISPGLTGFRVLRPGDTVSLDSEIAVTSNPTQSGRKEGLS